MKRMQCKESQKPSQRMGLKKTIRKQQRKRSEGVRQRKKGKWVVKQKPQIRKEGCC